MTGQKADITFIAVLVHGGYLMLACTHRSYNTLIIYIQYMNICTFSSKFLTVLGIAIYIKSRMRVLLYLWFLQGVVGPGVPHGSAIWPKVCILRTFGPSFGKKILHINQLLTRFHVIMSNLVSCLTNSGLCRTKQGTVLLFTAGRMSKFCFQAQSVLLIQDKQLS